MYPSGAFWRPDSPLPTLVLSLWPCCLRSGGDVVPFSEHTSGLRRTAQVSQVRSVCATGTHLPNHAGDYCGLGTLPLLSRAGALGACGTLLWAWASWLLEVSCCMEAPGSAPQDAFNEGAVPVGQTSDPLVSGPQG